MVGEIIFGEIEIVFLITIATTFCCRVIISEIIAGRGMIDKNCYTPNKCTAEKKTVSGGSESVVGGEILE